MSIVHMHLLLNHIPVVGAFVGIALFGYALARRSSEVTKVSLGLFVVLAAISVAVFLTGEPAEEAIEHLPGFSSGITEEHEEIGRLAMLAIVFFGALGAGALTYFRRRPVPRWLSAVALLISLSLGGLMTVTASLGGQIRHTEIRTGASAAEEVERDKH